MSDSPPTQRPKPTLRRADSLVLVNTGNGKGKTTAAMGVVLRALARDWQVCVVQFVKSGRWHSGEIRLISQLGADCHAMGDGFSWESTDLDRSAGMARGAWDLAKANIASGQYELVVLDEITYPMNWGWIDTTDVTNAISQRPGHVNVILTGREAPAAVVDIADTVSEVQNRKHAFDAGIRASKGIDF